jgi:GT2 family glycosyltransferase
MTSPAVSIIIPVFNQWRYTEECLRALFAHQSPELPIEVIVVDNGSTDETETELYTWRERWPVIRIERTPINLGFSEACNRGAKLASAPLLLFLNNDTIPQAGWLSPLVQALQAPGVGITGPKLVYPDGQRIQHAGYVFGNGAFYPIYHDRSADFPPASKMRDYQALLGACLLVRTELFRDLGGFMNGGLEDIDLCLQIGQRGLACRYVPNSIVYHHGQVSHLLNPPDSYPKTSQTTFYERWGHHPIAWDDYRWFIKDELWPRPSPHAAMSTSLELADRSMQATITAFTHRKDGELQSALSLTEEALRLWELNPIAFVLRCRLLLMTGARALFAEALAGYQRYSFSHRALIELEQLSQDFRCAL